MMWANIALSILNALCVPMNLSFYFYGGGSLNLICAFVNAGVAVFCGTLAYASWLNGDHGA